MSLISIIVPVYNAENTLRQCVDSILSQEYKDLELLLIDDGSKDGSPAICDEYAVKDERVRVFHKENGGVSSARNLGLDNAIGEWITFIDSDDYITEDYFESVADSDEDILIRGYKNIKNGQMNEALPINGIPMNISLREFIERYLPNPVVRCPWCKFYKKKSIENLRFLTEMKIGEDAQFVFTYLAKCQSYKLLSGGEYVTRVAEEPDDMKYAISVDYAVQSLRYLQEAFASLVKAHKINRRQFLPYISYFKRISKTDWQTDKSKWYDDKRVKSFYDYVWHYLSFWKKNRIIGTRILKK